MISRKRFHPNAEPIIATDANFQPGTPGAPFNVTPSAGAVRVANPGDFTDTFNGLLVTDRLATQFAPAARPTLTSDAPIPFAAERGGSAI